MTNPDAGLVRASAEYMDDAAAFLLPRHQTYTAEQLTHLAARLRSLADRMEGTGDGCKDDHAELTRVWAALGITEYTGKSASEHVAALKGAQGEAGPRCSVSYCTCGKRLAHEECGYEEPGKEEEGGND